LNSVLFRVSFLGLVVFVLALAVLVNIAHARGRVKGVEPGKDRAMTILHGGLKRSYLLHVPAGYRPDRAWPLVFVLHGGGGDGARVAKLTRFSREADRAGFIVVYPDAVNRHWNDGRRVQRFRAQREGVDDVGFVAALVERLAKDLGVDTNRVYATGISNGGMMCHRLGCEISGRIAAIAPVAASMPAPLLDSCRPAQPVSVLAINGTADPLVPFEGGAVGLLKKRGRVASVAQTVAAWIQANQCAARPETTLLPDTDPRDGVRVRRETWSGGRNGSEVILYTVEGGGHTWPGGTERLRRFGRTCRDIDATALIWQFFERHSR